MNLVFWEGVINVGGVISVGEVLESSSSVRRGISSMVVFRLSTSFPASWVDAVSSYSIAMKKAEVTLRGSFF